MDATAPEVDLVDVLIAGCSYFPGDAPDDPPMIMRDLPILVVALPWEDVQESMSEWGLCDISFGMVMSTDRAVIHVTLYDPYVSFKIKVPRPEYDEGLTQIIRAGWVGIQSDDGLECVLVKVSKD